MKLLRRAQRLHRPYPAGLRSFDALLVVYIIVIVSWVVWLLLRPVRA